MKKLLFILLLFSTTLFAQKNKVIDQTDIAQVSEPLYAFSAIKLVVTEGKGKVIRKDSTERRLLLTAHTVDSFLDLRKLRKENPKEYGMLFFTDVSEKVSEGIVIELRWTQVGNCISYKVMSGDKRFHRYLMIELNEKKEPCRLILTARHKKRKKFYAHYVYTIIPIVNRT